ncbi:unnamed protein product [Calypogeia fissa]
MEDDDDVPQLSASTLAALQSFLREQKAEQAHENEEEVGGLGFSGADAAASAGGHYEMVKENWGMSQFWYDADTSKTVADELHHLTADSSRTLPIACVACPSLYTQLKKGYPEAQVRLFEFDQRFSKYGADFVFYDYNRPLDIPSELQRSFHVVVADPPYLSQECLEKTVETMKYLAKDPENSPLMLLTGGVQRDNALKFLNARRCRFRPAHTNKLGNEFLLFTNYDPQSRLGGWDIDD